MPYGTYRTYGGRRYRFGRRRYNAGVGYRRSMTKRSLARFNRRIMRQANRQTQALSYRGWMGGSLTERKYYDLAWNGVTVTGASPIIDCLCMPTQSAGTVNRIGNRVLVRSIHLRASIWTGVATNGVAASTNYQPSVVRICILVDKQPNGAFPAASDIFETSGTAPDAICPMNLAYRNRFVVLKDKTIQLGGAISTATANQAAFNGTHARTVTIHKKVKIPVDFITSTGTGAIADIRSNAILLYINTDAGGVGNDIITLWAHTRTRFTDS